MTNVTGLSLTSGVTGVLPVANGGTNASSAGITAFNNITGYTASGATGTTSTNLVFSASPTFTGTVTAAAETLSGTLTTNVTGGGTQCLHVNSSGVVSGTGSDCGAGGGGSGTVNSGTQYQMAYYASTGTAVSGDANITTDASNNLNLALGTFKDTQAINATSTDGLVLQNTTAATSGNQKWSPRIHFTGQGWKTNATAASQTVDVIEELQPVQGAAAPTGNLVWSSQVNGGGYGGLMTLSSGGLLGIGTATPLASLEAWATGSAAPLYVRAATDEGLVVAKNNNMSSGVQILTVNDAANAIVPMEITASLFDIDGGNVGIGSTSPRSLLDVAGNVYATQFNGSGAGLSNTTRAHRRYKRQRNPIIE
ncbi:MAG TPA: hypothetical protein VE986_10045 [Hyphomicrobiales bacterium]|nr:hypothetical protein [Hyphomicrobiales bacterium]